MEDLEGYNDIWNNILGEDIVRQTDIINDSTYDID